MSVQHDTDTFIRLTHPEIEWAPFEENHTVFHGVEGAMRVRIGWLDTWAEHQQVREAALGLYPVVAVRFVVVALHAAASEPPLIWQ